MAVKGPKRQLVVTFHSKETGRRHGPVLMATGNSQQIAAEHRRVLETSKLIGPHLKNISPRISETNVGTTVSFHGIPQTKWDKIFGKKKKK
ncbi:Uncharacterised protein [uncultured archaeon]|nr:Uncharacterised protein [uncultured archaeon]